MIDKLAQEMIERLRTHKSSENHETIAIRISRELIPVLQKYRGRVVGPDGKQKAESWASVGEKLIRVADEMLEARACEFGGGTAGLPSDPAVAGTAKA